MATYFIRIDTYWQNSPDRFVGPFDSKADAQAAIDEFNNNSGPQDIKNDVRIHEVMSKTAAKQSGMKSWSEGDHSDNTLPSIPENTSALMLMEQDVSY